MPIVGGGKINEGNGLGSLSNGYVIGFCKLEKV